MTRSFLSILPPPICRAITRAPLLSAAALLCLLPSCGRADDDAASGGLTVGESERLDAAAQRLDSRAEPPGRAAAQALEQETAQRLAQENAAKSE
ncbi:MAG: hypothetical protein ACKOUM_09815 [Sphingopyxis sp.]